MKLRILAVALAFFAFSCQNNDSSSESSADTASTQSMASSTTSGVAFKTMQGETVNLSAFQDKVVFLNFWATWCGPCIKEMPSMQAFYDQYKNHPDVEFMVVEVDNKPDLATKFVEENSYTFPIFSPGSVIPETLLGQAIPTTVVLDKNGNIAYRHEGMSDFMSDGFINMFEGVLNK